MRGSDAAEGRYDSRIVDRLDAHEFFDPGSVRWYRSIFFDRPPERRPGTDNYSDHGDQVGPDMVTDQAPLRLTTRQRAIVDACDVPRSLVELMERANVSHRSHFRTRHLKPLLQVGAVRMTNPGNPRASNQKYVLTETGAGLKATWVTA